MKVREKVKDYARVYNLTVRGMVEQIFIDGADWQDTENRIRASLSFRKTCDYFRDNFGEMLCRRPNLNPSKCDMSCQMGQKFLDIYDNEK